MENQRKNSLGKLIRTVMPPTTSGIFLEWRGKRRLVAEGIDGLLEYGETRMTVSGGKERIGIFGKELEMRYLSNTCIVIEGDINKVCYLTEGENP